MPLNSNTRPFLYRDVSTEGLYRQEYGPPGPLTDTQSGFLFGERSNQTATIAFDYVHGKVAPTAAVPSSGAQRAKFVHKNFAMKVIPPT